MCQQPARRSRAAKRAEVKGVLVPKWDTGAMDLVEINYKRGEVSRGYVVRRRDSKVLVFETVRVADGSAGIMLKLP